MNLHMLVIDEQMKTKPDLVEITHEWGKLTVVFDDEHGIETFKGLHCFVSGEQSDIVEWLKPFDVVIKGNGAPMFEQFEMSYIK